MCSITGPAPLFSRNWDFLVPQTGRCAHGERTSHGLSDPITTADDGDTLIKDVVEFVKAKKFEKLILMGHSMGGATVIRVGAEYPDLAKAIIVFCSAQYRWTSSETSMFM